MKSLQIDKAQVRSPVKRRLGYCRQGGNARLNGAHGTGAEGEQKVREG